MQYFRCTAYCAYSSHNTVIRSIFISMGEAQIEAKVEASPKLGPSAPLPPLRDATVMTHIPCRYPLPLWPANVWVFPWGWCSICLVRAETGDRGRASLLSVDTRQHDINLRQYCTLNPIRRHLQSVKHWLLNSKIRHIKRKEDSA